MVNYEYDKVEGFARPTMYPGENDEQWVIPDGVSADYHRLNAIIESKYSREYLKICAFYNKMFPSLKTSEWTRSSYNVPPFTTYDQERADTGTGNATNYLKQIVDQITSRLGTITFVPSLISEDQSLDYIVYKDEVERVLRMYIRNDDLNQTCLEAFHDASILGYSHVFLDPYTGHLVKASDYELGIFESQFNKGKISQMLYRDYAFPVSEVLKYLVDCDDDEKKEVLDDINGRDVVDFKMYFDCPKSAVYVTINNKTLPMHNYPFTHVLMATFAWDVGFSKVTSTSLFDLLYPLQREVNKINAKIQQLIRMYKGPTPVFNNDVDLAMKAITNGSGECLYVDSTRPIDSLMTVINPTPLDSQLSAERTEHKTIMYELAGLQNMTFNMDNMRSASAVIALDQTRDSVFQAQLSGMSRFVKSILKLYIDFFAVVPDMSTLRHIVDWPTIAQLVDRSYIDLQAVHLNDPLSSVNTATNKAVDYEQLAIARLVLKIIRGEITWDALPYYIDKAQITGIIAVTLVKFEALGIAIPDTMHIFLVNAFIDEIAAGFVQI